MACHAADLQPARPHRGAAAVGGAAARGQPHHLPPRPGRVQAEALRSPTGGFGFDLLGPGAGTAAEVSASAGDSPTAANLAGSYRQTVRASLTSSWSVPQH